MNMEAIERQPARLLVLGIVGGVIAGIVFAMADMVMAVVVMGGSFFDPMRMIGAIVLGQAALDPSYPLLQAGLVGMMLHMMLSAVYGVVFVYLLAVTRQLWASTGALLVYGSIFGLILWVANFLVVAPIAFPWFGMVNQFWLGFVAHTFFFGTVVGLYTARGVRPRIESRFS